MQDLTPVGLSSDGTKLVLVDASGEEFAVPVDSRLRAAMRGDTARLGQLEMKMESALRPRDIQARIRAGESPEDVAAAAQTTVESIMGFATPVLAERAHVARGAQNASVRRSPEAPASSGARTLGDAAEAFLSGHGLHEEDVEWDAWRRQDGRWMLVAHYTVGGRDRVAEFTHDVRGRYVVADNDDAKLLTGELQAPSPGPGVRQAAARRLSSVPNQDELPLGDDAIELVREREQTHPATDDTDAGLPAETADADWIATEPAQEQLGASGPDEADREQDPSAGPDDAPAEQAADESDGDSGDDLGQRPAGRGQKRKGRASVPSWDEIMFGGGQSD